MGPEVHTHSLHSHRALLSLHDRHLVMSLPVGVEEQTQGGGSKGPRSRRESPLESFRGFD
jgi:hypothetical protein